MFSVKCLFENLAVTNNSIPQFINISKPLADSVECEQAIGLFYNDLKSRYEFLKRFWKSKISQLIVPFAIYMIYFKERLK